MPRLVWLLALVLAPWALGLAAEPEDDGDSEVYIKVIEETPDGSVDGGDGGVDGGEDGGVVDAGPVDAGHGFVERWWWMADGGRYPSGATDRVEVRLGRWVEAQFYKPAVLTVCDAPLVNVVGMGESVRFFAVDAGATQCGFWLGPQQPFPDRLVDVVVYPPDW